MSVDQNQSNVLVVLPQQPNPQSSDDYWSMSETPVRRYHAAGLANLGNTCFMNSTLQCLAHTTPLQRYFLTGDYDRDLNKDNPLGTGGELATQFAQLLGELWNQRQAVVYPRNFKYTLGQHAEQFMGYDQHDSQELATYLLDALHEDTNRVTKKPYVEKPEQEENETDQEASDKAWSLHLQREDSKIVDNFVGQIKSRVQCNTPGCGRVSTTFDPFMYLSVPIPGSSERVITITFVPLDPMRRAVQMTLTLNKNSSIGELVKRMRAKLAEAGHIAHEEALPMEDLQPVDVWQGEIYSVLDMDKGLDTIRDNDVTCVYELFPVKEIRQLVEMSVQQADHEGGDWSAFRPKRYKLDLALATHFRNCDLVKELSKYSHNPLEVIRVFNVKRSDDEARINYYKRFVGFLDLCYSELDKDTNVPKRPRIDDEAITTSGEEEPIEALRNRSDTSSMFKNVNTVHDLAILEALAFKLRENLLAAEKNKRKEHPDGILLRVGVRKAAAYARDQVKAAPLLLRVPPGMTVFGLREELAARLRRVLRTGHAAAKSESGQSTAESGAVRDDTDIEAGLGGFGEPGLLLMRYIPMTYEQKSSSTYRANTVAQTLGSIEKYDERSASQALQSHDDEKKTIAEVIGENGAVNLEWPQTLFESSFNLDEYEKVETIGLNEEEARLAKKKASSVTTVLDCIEKYCQKEQLEESEMWYCSRCKNHVRAWKQFHLYRAPPVLIVHLKRFQFSASTHRRDKISAFIDFPLEDLDLTEHTMHFEEGQKPVYDCFAVSNHYGGLGGGHYTAYAQTGDGSWCHYDDSRVSTAVDPKEVISEAAYVLYYRRKDVPWNSDFLQSLQTVGPRPAVIDDLMPIEKPPSTGNSSNAAIVDEGDTMEVEDDFNSLDFETDDRQSPIPDSNDELPLQ